MEITTDFGLGLSKGNELAIIVKTVLEYWKNGNYETPKKYWDIKSLESYYYLSDIYSYKPEVEIMSGAYSFICDFN
jgi:hypothetical protein